LSAEDWTEANVGLLKVLWLQGLSATECARRLPFVVSRSAVIGKVSRLGLPGRRNTRPMRGSKGLVKDAPAKPRIPKQPTIKPVFVRERGALRGPANVPFINRRPNQCPMFCAGEDGAHGLVCGEPVEVGSWCRACGPMIFQPVRKRAA